MSTETTYRLVRASERLPQVGIYNALYNGDHIIFQVHDGGFRVINYHGEKEDAPKLNLVKWLEQLPSPTTERLRTKEEILATIPHKVIPVERYEGIRRIVDRDEWIKKSDASAAMEEYANQFKAAPPTEEEIKAAAREEIFGQFGDTYFELGLIRIFSAGAKWMIEKQNVK